MTTDPTSAAQSGVALVGELIAIAKDNPKAQEAADNIGSTALTITKAINNVLLPIAAVNFAFDKARSYFSTRFSSDLSEKTLKIPAENLIEPRASIAGPVLQGLAFNHEEPVLRSLFLELIATAMDSRMEQNAHPAFVEVIKQLNSEEALLLQGLIADVPCPIVQVKRQSSDGSGYIVVCRHLLNLIDEAGASIENPRTPSMLDNLERLGLIQCIYGTYLTATDAYTWCESRPEYLRLKQIHETDGHTVEFERGILQVTAFGSQFAWAIGLGQ